MFSAVSHAGNKGRKIPEVNPRWEGRELTGFILLCKEELIELET
jgi:hypothetical protein